MILTVTLNAALDVTYDVPALVPRTSHRVQQTHERAGGKGVNVSRVLHALDRPSVVTGLAGGTTGQLIREDVQSAGLTDELLTIDGESRRTVAIVSREDGDATIFNQPGPTVRPAEWDAFTVHFGRLVATARVAVLSGSLPPGLPDDAYGRLVRIAQEVGNHGEGAATVVDTSGPALRATLPSHPDIIKPNAAELAALAGDLAFPDSARALRTRGARGVVASAGPDGLYAHTPHGAWYATPPTTLAGNPTGAGDACVAALAAGLADGRTDDADGWPDVLREAVALSAAAVVRPVAGEFDADVHRRFRSTVTVRTAQAEATQHPRT